MTEYFIVYVLLWILAGLNALKDSQSSNKFYWMQGGIVLIFSAFRFETGYDWPVYDAHYKGEMGNGGLVFEPGYELLVLAFSKIGLPFKYFLSIITAMMVVALMVLTRRITPRYKEIAVAITFSLPDFFLIPVFSVIRQTISLLILLIGIIWLCDAKRKRAYLTIMLSFLFHYSTIIILIIIIIVRRFQPSKSSYIFIFSISMLGYLTSIDFSSFLLKIISNLIFPNYSLYLTRDTFNASFFYRMVTGVLSGIVFFMVIKSKIYSTKNLGGQNSYFMHIASMSLLLPILLFNFPTFSSRFLFLGSFFILAISLCYVHETLKIKRLITCLFCSVLFAVPLYRFLSSPFSSPYVPYQSMVSYDERNSTGNERTQDLLDMLNSLW